MWLVFLVLIFILGIIFSSIEANLYSINVTEQSSNFKVKIIFKLFCILPIFAVHLDKFGIKIWGKRILYKNIINHKKIRKVNKDILELFFKDINIEFKKIHFTLNIGLIEIALTNIAIVLISIIFPFLIKKRIDRKNLKYNVFPSYNKLLLDLRGEISISIKSSTLLKSYFKNIKPEITHNKNKNYGVKESF